MSTTRLDERRGRSPLDDAITSVPAEALLQAWTDGQDVSPGERGLILLRAAAPTLSDIDRASLTVGRRDTMLLDLFERLFGATATALAGCPHCGEQLEFDVPLNQIRVPAADDPPPRFTLRSEGWQITYRLPRASDLAAIGAQAHNDAVRTVVRSLAERCVLSIENVDGMPRTARLTDDVALQLEAAIAAAVAEADPQAVVTLTFDCPSCALHWQSPFDIVEFLWRRTDVFVRGLLREVHVLASRYGWSEREILSLAPTRRRYYIELAGT